MDSRRTVLLVEGEDADADALTAGLRAHCPSPTAVVRCRTAAEALARLRGPARPDAPAVRPVLILLAAELPDGPGSALLRVLKADDAVRAVPVVVTARTASPRAAADCYCDGAGGFLLKPADPAVFAAALATLCHYWFSVVTLPPAASR